MWRILLSIFIQFSFAQQALENFPNPRTNGYKACGLKSKGYVCDLDKVLTEQERYRLNNDLLQLSRRTSTEQSSDFCSTKGIDATLLILKQANEQLAEQINKQWDVDGQCQRSVVFVLSADDHRLYYAAEEQAGISLSFVFIISKSCERNQQLKIAPSALAHTFSARSNFEAAVAEQQQLFAERKYVSALSGVFKKIADSIQPSSKKDGTGTS
ncbi:unnamed protein product [Thelazia callipaeda]|uniref:TPM domain-containing protein n=1 Tax=Thelazia callipaeda TaxID=103827 RepID=A0A0N5CXG8_THECL|nr:unnamed protein product [Thelazia callipaeda]